jgi:hypothetical protein
MQTRRSILGSLALSLLFASAPAFPQEKKAGPTIQVQLNYTGSGTVDDKHKIYVALWDSADFMQGAGTMPVLLLPADSKTGTVTFTDVKTIPAYVSCVFDPTGSWDAASGPPPSGSALGVYSKTPGQPEPIKGAPGETVKVTLAFDDTAKMP